MGFFGSGTDPMPLVTVFLFFLLGQLLPKSLIRHSNRMKFGWIVLHLNRPKLTHQLTESDFWYDSYFQDNGHDICSLQQRPPAARYPTECMTPLACCIRYSSWSL